MNATKAREYFSPYYEGDLEAGLRQAFEHALAADAELKREYESFAHSMNLLGGLKEIEIEVPFDLSDRINARIDHAIWEKSQQKAKPWFTTQWFRLAAVTGVAGIAILGTIFALTSGQKSGPGVASPIPIAAKGEPEVVTYRYEMGQLWLDVEQSDRGLVSILGEDGQTVKELSVSTEARKSPFTNNQSAPILIEVRSRVAGQSEYVAIPGLEQETQANGSGSVRDLLLALSTWYRTAVVFSGSNLDQAVTWEFKGQTLGEANLSKISLPGLIVVSKGTVISVTETDSR